MADAVQRLDEVMNDTLNAGTLRYQKVPGVDRYAQSR
jgi:hypothetical protein